MKRTAHRERIEGEGPKQDNASIVDNLIDDCQLKIKYHNTISIVFLVLCAILILAPIISIWPVSLAIYRVYGIYSSAYEAGRTYQARLMEPHSTGQSEPTPSVSLGGVSSGSALILSSIVGCIGLLIGVSLAGHRFHANESARLYLLESAYHRIKLAGLATAEGFEGDIREQLVMGAFDAYSLVQQRQYRPKASSIESPLPGNVTSDVAAAVVNRIFEFADEIKLKSKDQKQEGL